jgi:hypothetical protein
VTVVGDGVVGPTLVGALGDIGLVTVPGMLLPSALCPVRLPGCPVVVLPVIDDVGPGDVVEGRPSNVLDGCPGVVVDGNPGVVVGLGNAVVGGSDGAVNGVVGDADAPGSNGGDVSIGTHGANRCCETAEVVSD